MSAPKAIFQQGEHLKDLVGYGSIDNPDSLRNSQNRRKPFETMAMARLNFFADHLPAVLVANGFQKCFNGLSNGTGKNVPTILRTPDQMVGRLIDTTSLRFNLNHVSNPNNFKNCSQEQFLEVVSIQQTAHHLLRSRFSLLQKVL
jgi:hypothetical protein